jgi:hypothetical protein
MVLDGSGVQYAAHSSARPIAARADDWFVTLLLNGQRSRRLWQFSG